MQVLIFSQFKGMLSILEKYLVLRPHTLTYADVC
jgi:SNF2 family DNA or RNA helicase